ncbi:hypothetical protein G7046_g8573 [Stylonectria norvegica]|nr:hypothetical protein G7046_g8573 [Stylonectria norvegica]
MGRVEDAEARKERQSSSSLSSISEPKLSHSPPALPRSQSLQPSPKLSPRSSPKLSPPGKDDIPLSNSPASATEKPPKPVRVRKPKKKVAKKAPRKSKWDAQSIFVDPKSPLASADLRTILSNPMAWDILEEEDRAEILSLFPDDQHILAAGTQDARPDFVSLMNDDSFRHDCAAYTENIAQGRHDPDWLAEAWAAHERRKAGDFDDFLETRFKEEWGQELPEKPKSDAAAAMNEMVVEAPATEKEDDEIIVEAPASDQEDAEIVVKAPAIEQEDVEMGDGVDELQAQNSDQKDRKVISVIQQRPLALMGIDPDRSEDELA